MRAAWWLKKMNTACFIPLKAAGPAFKLGTFAVAFRRLWWINLRSYTQSVHNLT